MGFDFVFYLSFVICLWVTCIELGKLQLLTLLILSLKMCLGKKKCSLFFVLAPFCTFCGLD